MQGCTRVSTFASPTFALTAAACRERRRRGGGEAASSPFGVGERDESVDCGKYTSKNAL